MRTVAQLISDRISVQSFLAHDKEATCHRTGFCSICVHQNVQFCNLVITLCRATLSTSLSGLKLTANRANRRSDAHTQFDIRLVFMNARSLLGLGAQGTTAACRRFSRVRALPLSEQHCAKKSLNLHPEGKNVVAARDQAVQATLFAKRGHAHPERDACVVGRKLRENFFPGALEVTAPFQPGTTVKARRLCAPKAERSLASAKALKRHLSLRGFILVAMISKIMPRISVGPASQSDVRHQSHLSPKSAWASLCWRLSVASRRTISSTPPSAGFSPCWGACVSCCFSVVQTWLV